MGESCTHLGKCIDAMKIKCTQRRTTFMVSLNSCYIDALCLDAMLDACLDANPRCFTLQIMVTHFTHLYHLYA